MSMHTHNVLAESLQKKYTDCCQKNHGFSSIACSATYFGFHGCHVLFGIMSSILCGYGMQDTGREIAQSVAFVTYLANDWELIH